MRRRELIITLAAAGLAVGCGAENDQRVGPPAEVALLSEDLSTLKAAFNAAPSKVRLLFLVGPTCGPCLRGLIDLNAELGAALLSDQRLDLLVVHVPTLSAEYSHAQRAAQLMRGSSVRHYWDASGRIGEVVQQTLKIPVYAWDVWLTYAPGPLWVAEAPPAPAAWSHQLGGLREGARLDPEAFAADVRARVEQLA